MADPTSTTKRPTRLSYAEFCPQVLPHLSAAADLVTEFVAEANAGTLTYSVPAEDRFDTVIDDFDRDRRVAPQPLVRLINAQRDALVQMRGQLQIGGERVIELEAFRTSGPEIITRCGENT